MRHYSSFVISLLIHGVLLASLFLAYKELKPLFSESTKEKRVSVPLCCLTKEQRAVPHVHDTPVETPKPQKQTTPKPPKKTVKKEPKSQKAVVKEVKEIPVVKEIEPPKEIEEASNVEESLKEEADVLKEQVTEDKKSEPESSPEFTSEVQTQTQKTPTKSAQEQYMDEHLAQIVALLQENLYYPRSARRRGVEGEVLVAFVLRKDASVSNMRIVSSEHTLLSKGAIETIESLAGKFPHPSEDLELTIPINYTLRK